MKYSFLILLVCLSLIILFQGCGGGGSGSGAGLGSASGNTQARLRISFADALNLSKSKIVSDYDLSYYHANKPSVVQNQASFSWSEVLGEKERSANSQLSQELKAKAAANSRLRLAVAGLRDKICQYRVTITASDLFIPVVASFPEQCLEGVAPPDSGVVEVEAGQLRKIKVEGIGLEFDGTTSILAAAEATLDLTPSVTTNLGGPTSSVPLEFEEIDVTAPVTAIFLEEGGSVSGPHRSSVVIHLDNFESLPVTYRITEKDNPVSTLSALTSGFVTASPPVLISLSEEGVYLFEFHSRDSAGNIELINEREVEVNFNTSPPTSVVDYSGRPTKVLAGSQLGLSIEMENSQTGTITYQLDSNSAVTTRALKNKEVELVKFGTQGIVPDNPVISLSFSSKIPGGSVELSPNQTEVELTEILIDGDQKTTYEGAATSVMSSGVIIFCDTQSDSIYTSEQCNNTGKRVMMLQGPFSPGIADEFACIQIVSGVVSVIDEGVNGTCQGCGTYEGQTGIQCP